MLKDYYLILGVRANATLEEVKSAFRRRAMEVHPDHSGRGSGPFLEIQEAYDVLSDPERRRTYDRQNQSTILRHPKRNSEPLRRPRASAEPLRQNSFVRDHLTTNLFDIHRPSFEERFERFWSNFHDWSRLKTERLENITVEAVLDAQEALQGGTIRLRIPRLVSCPICSGRGDIGIYECWQCLGQGALLTECPLEVQYPPNILDGHIARISLNRLGIKTFYLTLLFRISNAEA